MLIFTQYKIFRAGGWMNASVELLKEMCIDAHESIILHVIKCM